MYKQLNIPQGLQITNSATQKRIPRRPSHPFHLRSKPYQVQPFLLAPVLAGETMKNLLMQSRVVTDPIKNPLIGWHAEYYFFYVKLRDFTDSATMEEMILDMGADISSVEDSTPDEKYYHHGGINYAKLCLERVMDCYFRDEGESPLLPAIDGLPIAQAPREHFFNSLHAESELESDDLASTDLPQDFGDLETKWNTWQYMRQAQLTQQSFEDYMATFGIRNSEAEEEKKPELIRFVRQWQYPSNTVDPATGAPSSAVSWSIQERADKDRLFKEPGFLFGVTVFRPKIYFGNQREHASHLLDNTFSWLPAVFREQVQTSIKTVAAGSGPAGGVFPSDPYVVDVRDLLVYGDQFVNFDMSSTDAGLVALPKPTFQASKYVSEEDIAALWVDQGEGENPPTRNLVRQDGVVTLNILGTQQDYT